MASTDCEHLRIYLATHVLSIYACSDIVRVYAACGSELPYINAIIRNRIMFANVWLIVNGRAS